MISFLILIYFLTIANSLEIYINGATAVLVGLLGVREIFIPTDIQVRNLIDVSILGLYVAFGMSIFIQIFLFIIGNNKQTKKSNIRSSEIDNISNKKTSINAQGKEKYSITSSRKQETIILFAFIIIIGIVGWFNRDKEK